MSAEIAVIGAGVIGLSSAVAIQQKHPKVKVTIIADKFDRHTTSDGSGGLFVPSNIGSDEKTFDFWAREGAKHFFDLAFSSECGASGMNLMTGFVLLEDDEKKDFFKYMLQVAKMSPELMKYFPSQFKNGYLATTVTVEGPKYLPWLMKKFKNNGGKVIEKKVESFQEMSGKYDIVINCTGLGSMELASDNDLRPLRGQLLRASAPWIKYFIFSEDRFFVLPTGDTVALGGSKQPGRSDTAPIASESEALWRGFKERYPHLEGAKILWDWIGLRPYRSKVRLEPEVMTFNGKPLKIIHNYGHGTVGVSLSWGTAVHVAQLVEGMLNKAKL